MIDLTQLTLGADRDSELLGGYDERDEAVLDLMALAIDACHEEGKRVGICGQAPSDFPEITRRRIRTRLAPWTARRHPLMMIRPVCGGSG